MPCNICNSTLIIYDNEEICPKCRGLAILDSVTAIFIIEKIFSYLKKLFYDEIKKWDTYSLISYFAAKREMISRDFFKEYSSLPIGDLAEYTLLIRDCLLYGNSDRNGRTPTSEEELKKLLSAFRRLLDFENSLLQIKSCNGNVLFFKKFNENEISSEEALKILEIVDNEKFEEFKKTFKMYEIYTEEEADRIIEQNKKQLTNTADLDKIEIIPPAKYVKRHFDIISRIYFLFLRNFTYLEVFKKLERYQELTKDPRNFYYFVNHFLNFGEETFTVTPLNIFIKKAQNYFQVSEEKIKDILIFNKSNNNTFPLFTSFYDKTKDEEYVFISRVFSGFIYSILHIFITKNIFDDETQRRSLEFEKKSVKSEFEKIGYFYKSNIGAKNKLEIDGIAFKDYKCYIIECKGWRLPKLIDERIKRDEIIRDLRGIVDGEKYTNTNNVITKRRIPSLKNKIEYIRNNYLKYINTKETNLIFEGLIVISIYPPISSYKDIKIISIDQIPNIK